MNFLGKLYGKLKDLFKKISTRHFNNKLKKIEFTILLLINIILFFVLKLKIFSPEVKGIISQGQALTAIYLSFRFIYFGFATVFVFSFAEIFLIMELYYSTHDDSYLTALTVKIFTLISSFFVSFLANTQEIQKNRLHCLSITDDLTNIYNLRFFQSRLEKEIETAKNEKSSVGLVMIDIDNFKMYNDIYGHDCGDDILKLTSASLKEILQGDGILCRYGGDEFAIILPDTDRHTIEKIARRIKKDFHGTKAIRSKYNIFNNVTLSMGASEYPYMSNSKEELITQADTALYHTKNLGKDSIHFYQDVVQHISKIINSDRQQLIGVFKGLLSTISAKDKYTLGHCERVSAYAVIIGEAMNLSLDDIATLQYAGLLHDIGKIELPKSILNKSGKLTAEEFRYIQLHPVYSANILEPLEGMNQLIEQVKHHHERFDGKGYPDGLAGEEINLGARILCVADSFDAMLSDRPYSKSMVLEAALSELERCSGTQFDPKIADIFIKIMKEKLLSKRSEEDVAKTTV